MYEECGQAHPRHMEQREKRPRSGNNVGRIQHRKKTGQSGRWAESLAEVGEVTHVL